MKRTRSMGIGLVEMLIAMAIGTLLLSGLVAAVSDALQARDFTGQSNDLSVQAGFAMSRMAATIRNTASPAAGTVMSAAVANATSDWLSPYTYTFDPVAGTLTEVNGSAHTVIADHVTAFSAAIHATNPASSATFSSPLIDLVLTVGATGIAPLTVRSTTRIGGGTQ